MFFSPLSLILGADFVLLFSNSLFFLHMEFLHNSSSEKK